MNLHFNAAVTLDTLIFGVSDKLEVLLIKRKHDPYQGKWAIPGGFLETDETLEEGARRELYEETNIRNLPIYQFQTFGDPGRDPRGRTVTAAYYTLIKKDSVQPVGGDDAQEAEWFDMKNLPSLAFDHDMIIKHAIHALKRDLTLTERSCDLLENFTLEEKKKIIGFFNI